MFVEKKLSCGYILANFGNFLRNLGNFATIYALSCGEKLGPKTFVEKKRQIWGLHQSNQNKKGDDDFDFNADYRYCRLQLYKEE